MWVQEQAVRVCVSETEGAIEAEAEAQRQGDDRAAGGASDGEEARLEAALTLRDVVRVGSAAASAMPGEGGTPPARALKRLQGLLLAKDHALSKAEASVERLTGRVADLEEELAEESAIREAEMAAARRWR